MRSSPGRVLILIENLPLQRDARVTRQCRALNDAGYEVTVICPRSEEPLPAALENVRVRTYRAREGAGVADFLFEYAWAILAMSVLAFGEFLSRRRRFDLIQTCNPPDLLALVAAPYRLVGIPFVFDHHDLVPELFEARYGTSHGMFARAVRMAERFGVGLATRVLATNDSVRRADIERGGKAAGDVRVVRNGPELRRFGAVEPACDLSSRQCKVAVWVGVMGAYDGVETLIETMAVIVHETGRHDLRFVLVGDGDQRDPVERLIDELDVRPYVTLAGWVPQDEVHRQIRGADVGLAPDPPGPRSDRATVMKIMDYMALGLPVVSFESTEARVSAADAGVFVEEHSPAAFAKAILALIDDETQCAERGAAGRRRVEEELSWEMQAEAYVRALGELLPPPAHG